MMWHLDQDNKYFYEQHHGLECAPDCENLIMHLAMKQFKLMNFQGVILKPTYNLNYNV
jgi:hypothetical protein